MKNKLFYVIIIVLFIFSSCSAASKFDKKQKNVLNSFILDYNIMYKNPKKNYITKKYNIKLPYEQSFWSSMQDFNINNEKYFLGPTLFNGYIFNISKKEVFYRAKEKRKYYDMDFYDNKNAYMINRGRQEVYNLKNGKLNHKYKIEAKGNLLLEFNNNYIMDNSSGNLDDKNLYIYDNKFNEQINENLNIPILLEKYDNKIIFVYENLNKYNIYSDNYNLLKSGKFFNKMEINPVKKEEVYTGRVNYIKHGFIETADIDNGKNIYFILSRKRRKKKLYLYKYNLKTNNLDSVALSSKKDIFVNLIKVKNNNLYIIFDFSTQMIIKIEDITKYFN